MLDLVKVSVIVPVYNVEDYIRECLDSLCYQTLVDIEIICINDGSTDKSLEILREYESKNPKITVYSQENKGLSGARNAGMKHATGEYIYFIDSDDMLIPTALERMYSVSKRRSLDILLFKLINFDDETKEKSKSRYYDMKFLKEKVGEDIFSHEDVGNDLFRIAVTIQGKLFKRELIEDMQFIEGLIFEDNPFFIESFFRAERVYFLDEYLYLKRERSGSITSTHNEQFLDYISISNILIDICKRYGVYEKYKEGLYSKTLGNVYFRFSEVDDEFKDEYFQKIKQDFTDKKDEYDNDDVFQNGSERYKEIFYRGLDLKTPLEYDLSIKLFDLQEKLDRVNKEKSQINRERNRFLKKANKAQNRVDKLTIKNIALKKENRRVNQKNEKLEKQNSNLKNLNEEILNSTSWKITKPLRSIMAKFRN